MPKGETSRWAEDEFGAAMLGDKRRTERLVQIAAGIAKRPGGKVTEVFAESAERTATFRLIGNGAVQTRAIADAAHRACALRAKEYEYVFVPVDGSSLNLADWQRTKELGVVGARFVGAQGLHVMSAIAVAPDGTPLGLCGQIWWARRGRARKRGNGKHDRRRLESKETNHWLKAMRQTREAFNDCAPQTKPWFQLDRGGDAWPVILEGLHPEQLFTVRASYNRRLRTKANEPRAYLWDQLASKKTLGTYSLAIPARAGEKARTARIAIRTEQVTLDLLDERTGKRHPARLWAVLAKESSVSRRQGTIEWMLLTSYPADNFESAKTVVDGYAQRWRVEEFHRTWKSGACKVEETQLRARDHIERWATLSASVAMRILRLTYLSRVKPAEASTTELTQAEIDAVIALKKPIGFRRGQSPPISKVVTWIAELGGYTGKSSGGPPGAVVIRRGLERIQSLAEYFAEAEM